MVLLLLLVGTTLLVVPAYEVGRRAVRHLPQLDGVRALAVALVVLDRTGGPSFEDIGQHGVTLFFVLSAYLITGILLRARNNPPRRAIAIFYALDAFAVGALLAWYQHARGISRGALRWALGAGLVIVVHSSWLHYAHRGYILWLATERLGVSLISVALLATAAAGALPRVFAWRPVRAVGTISYGVYLWHLPIAWAVTAWAARMPVARPIATGGLAMVVLVSALSIAVASVSWIVLERTLNRLKRFVPYGIGA